MYQYSIGTRKFGSFDKQSYKKAKDGGININKANMFIYTYPIESRYKLYKQRHLNLMFSI